MIQCKDCEFYEISPDGRRTFKCDPYSNIKEPECLAKWQLLRLDALMATSRGLLRWYERMAPMQDKIFKYVQRELNDIDEADRWKIDDQDDDQPDPDDEM
ncbi:MAG: hypothetical protein ACYTFK_08480 [Planctomycetota bacterium]|jgi:hypothetical protein